MVHWNLLKRRQMIFAQIIALLAVGAVVIFYAEKDIRAIQSKHKIEIIQRMTIPLKEISGIDWRHNGSGLELLAVGDKKAEIALVDLQTGETKSKEFGDLLLRKFSLCTSPQSTICAKVIKRLSSDWEALKVADNGSIVLLQEHSETIITLDSDISKIESVIDFNLLEGFPKSLQKSAGKFRLNSLGEGLLLEGDRFLVAKEMLPMSIVELSPDESVDDSEEKIGSGLQRSRYKATRYWEIGGHSKCDFSDMDRFGNYIVALSQKCRQLYFFSDLPQKGVRVVPDTVVTLPREIKTPEALSILPDGRLVIASDTKKLKTNTFIAKFLGWEME